MKALTPTEQQLLPLFLEGKTTKQIAKLMSRSFKTVETHRNRILKKHGMHSMIELAHKLHAGGFNPPPPGYLDSSSPTADIYSEYARLGELIKHRLMGDQSVTISPFITFSLAGVTHPFSCTCGLCKPAALHVTCECLQCKR